VRTPIDADVPDIIDFTCPRCQLATAARFYGPCRDCIAVLRAEQGTDSSGVAATADLAYEPKMNVTPNFIATKD
jgi:rubredoxin